MYNTDIPNREELPSTAKLVRSTIIAAIVALVLLVTVVMPAEYALDPTGAGRLLGLTEMGEIKEQLAEEAHRHLREPVCSRAFHDDAAGGVLQRGHQQLHH